LPKCWDMRQQGYEFIGKIDTRRRVSIPKSIYEMLDDKKKSYSITIKEVQ